MPKNSNWEEPRPILLSKLCITGGYGAALASTRGRKVVQAAAIYGAVAWGVTEVVVTIVEQLFLPQWVSTLAVIFFVVGSPVAMFLSKQGLADVQFVSLVRVAAEKHVAGPPMQRRRRQTEDDPPISSREPVRLSQPPKGQLRLAQTTLR
jgi:hypothetical protein